jgi:hypothetical protein
MAIGPSMFMLDHLSHVALLDLASEFRIAPLSDPEEIRAAIALRDCERESRIRQLESAHRIWCTLERPKLHGDITTLAIERNAWSERALDAEQKYARLIVGSIAALVAIALIITIGAATA